ncbi:MAG: hypothetical protein VX656_06750 [Candidatus Latescibacterota bacterium]|nr:hypothetical protein [Candidatus Latescibacterota bacterium]
MVKLLLLKENHSPPEAIDTNDKGAANRVRGAGIIFLHQLFGASPGAAEQAPRDEPFS